MIGRGLVSLRIAVRRNGEDILICCDACADDFIIVRELDPMDTGSGAAHGADLAVIHREADGHAILGAKDDLLFTGDRKHSSEAVALIEADGDETVLVDILVFRKLRLLHVAFLRDHEEVLRPFLHIVEVEKLGDSFITGQIRNEIDERTAACGSRGFREFHGRLHVDLALVCEEEDAVVRGGIQDLPDIVFVLHLHAGDTAAALLLDTNIRRVHALDVVLLRQSDGHRFIRDEVGQGEVLLRGRDLGAAFIAEVFLFILELVFDDAHDLFSGGEEVFEVSDGFLHVLIVLFELVSFEACQLAQTHVEDGDGLLFRKSEFRHERLFRHIIGAGFTDGLDDFIDVVERDEETLQDVRFGSGLVEFILASSGDDFFLMLQVIVEDLLQVQDARMSVNQCQHDGTEIHLHLGMLEEIIQHDVRADVGTQLDSDAHAAAIGFIAKGSDAV